MRYLRLLTHCCYALASQQAVLLNEVAGWQVSVTCRQHLLMGPAVCHRIFMMFAVTTMSCHALSSTANTKKNKFILWRVFKAVCPQAVSCSDLRGTRGVEPSSTAVEAFLEPATADLTGDSRSPVLVARRRGTAPARCERGAELATCQALGCCWSTGCILLFVRQLFSHVSS